MCPAGSRGVETRSVKGKSVRFGSEVSGHPAKHRCVV
jgi:hypothetical protein